MKKLEKNPHLHDKVEFEILFTCFDFTLKKRMKELIDYGFTKTEIKIINDQLRDFTNELIKNTPHILKQTDSSLKILHDKRKDSKKKINGYKSKFSNAETLLKNCKRYGIIQFAAVARFAFIANSIIPYQTQFFNNVSALENLLLYPLIFFLPSFLLSCKILRDESVCFKICGVFFINSFVKSLN
jgi:phosphoenolpyruvate synthase/pyruvate phosphate dikinase